MHCSMPEKLKSMIYKRVLKLIKKKITQLTATQNDAEVLGFCWMFPVKIDKSRNFCRNKIAEGMTVTLAALDLFDS